MTKIETGVVALVALEEAGKAGSVDSVGNVGLGWRVVKQVGVPAEVRKFKLRVTRIRYLGEKAEAKFIFRETETGKVWKRELTTENNFR